MATTQQELDLAFKEVGTIFKGILTKLGNLDNLNDPANSSAEFTSLVQAINVALDRLQQKAEILDDGTSYNAVWSSQHTVNEVGLLVGPKAEIDDNSEGSEYYTYSAYKIENDLLAGLQSLKDEILGGAGPTVDTLKELAEIIAAGGGGDTSGLVAAIAKRVRFDEAQTLTPAEKVQANANMGSVSLVQFGDPAHSYKDVFLAALQ